MKLLLNILPLSATSTASAGAGDYNVTPYTLIMGYNKTYLAEHHIYGSSRLGIKSYMPSQHYYSKTYDEDSILRISYHTLNSKLPWYSLEHQDLVVKDSLLPYKSAFKGQGEFSHLAGQRGYELTNHLGNVQVVVSDQKLGVDVDTNTSIDYYRPGLKAIYDYYPFGMLMPGRFNYDTATQCVTIYHPEGWQTYTPVSYGPAIYSEGLSMPPAPGPNGDTVGNLDEAEVIESGEQQYYHIAAQDAGSGIVQHISVNPGHNHYVSLDVLSTGGGYNAIVSQYVDDEWVTIASEAINSSGQTILSFHPTSTTVQLQILRTAAMSGTSLHVSLRPDWWMEEDYEPSEMRVTMCKAPKDNYRFGFNGQEKDNEMKGIGNSLDFGARMYDSRLGRWLSLDPLSTKYPALSPYNFVANSPIIALDPDGKEIWIAHRDKNTGSLIALARYDNGKIRTFIGSKNDPYLNKVANHINENNTVSENVQGVNTALVKSKDIHVITNFDHRFGKNQANRNREISDNYDDFDSDGKADIPKGSITTYDPDDNTSVRGDKRAPRVSLGHELKHAYNRMTGRYTQKKTKDGIRLEEIDAVKFENEIREQTGDPKRTKYGGKEIPAELLK